MALMLCFLACIIKPIQLRVTSCFYQARERQSTKRSNIRILYSDKMVFLDFLVSGERRVTQNPCYCSFLEDNLSDTNYWSSGLPQKYIIVHFSDDLFYFNYRHCS